MKPWATWLARLGIAGACFLVTGCGGGDVPDASSEGQAAAEGNPDAGGGGEAPAVAAEPRVARADREPKAEEPSADAPAATPEPETPAAEAKPPAAPGNSNTAEMLAMATGPASPPAGGAAPPGDSSTPPASPGGPGGAGPGAMMGPGAGPGGPGGPAGMMPGMGPGTPGPGGRMGPQMGPNAPGQAGGRDAMARMAAGMNPGGPAGAGATMRPPGMGGPGPGMPGRPGGAQVDSGPVNLHTPEGAVRAFLNALKAKDADRLNESTALRAPTEASTKNQDLFRKIGELSLSDSELDDLANTLDGYTVAGENASPKSTKRVDVILQKRDNKGGLFQRKITVRLEKKGWGVLDIGRETRLR